MVSRIRCAYSLCSFSSPFRVAMNITIPKNEYATSSKLEKEKEAEIIKKLLQKKGIKKKTRGRLGGRLRLVELGNKIQKASISRENTPDHEKDLSVRQKFKQLPFDTKILDYIKKHSLHRLKNHPAIRQSVNSFVDKVRRKEFFIFINY